MADKAQSKEPTQYPKGTLWHDWLGTLLLEVLTRFGILVKTNFPVTTLAPKADILLIRILGEMWNEEQRRYVPDGFRDSSASHLLGDLKYTQSINEDSFLQVGYYNYQYRKSQNLKKSELESFLLSSRTPQRSRLAKWGYKVAEHPGIYRNEQTVLRLMPIISLNELRNEPHNAVIKCFASQPAEREKGLAHLREFEMAGEFSEELTNFLAGLWAQWQLLGEMMDIQFTPEQVIEIGKKWGDIYLHNMSPAQRLAGLRPEELLSFYQPDQLVSPLTPAQRLAGLPPEEIRAYLAQVEQSNGSSNIV